MMNAFLFQDSDGCSRLGLHKEKIIQEHFLSSTRQKKTDCTYTNKKLFILVTLSAYELRS
jgi:hypothetical protein